LRRRRRRGKEVQQREAMGLMRMMPRERQSCRRKAPQRARQEGRFAGSEGQESCTPTEEGMPQTD
jgi:hypothetical protein